MNKLNLSEQQLNHLIEQSVKKHIRESYEEEAGGIDLIHQYVDGTIKILTKVKRMLRNPEADYLLQEDEGPLELIRASLGSARDLYDFLKVELGSTKAPEGYDEKDFKNPVKVKRKDINLNERKG
jgi:hypothetical protein